MSVGTSSLACLGSKTTSHGFRGRPRKSTRSHG
ncbi:hypothetical protein H310_15402 [Aphanomyces invadans]|uniref:Uncharacterized protein n=1 Tax=Aphanomyces invadans TaxID=157072 RepID=A0A024T7I1_9STRA|nr:hypothetical protein H310_15402 [Aphanomyces invadans]ETV89769.1 hypothetical protein H310_15402 [Aphanomyces invadans]|eukprot:XP_008881599.1 hypothetical protein H310_15402 [Aphanomyces invadans]